MPDVWRVYRVKKCRHTHPPKDKFVVVVCKDTEYLGFLVNSDINPFILKRPHLLGCQVQLKKVNQGFLFHDSYLDCSRLYPFNDNELMIGLDIINEKIRTEIKIVVSNAKTIEKRYIDLILSN